MTESDWTAIWVTLSLAVTSSVILLFIAVPFSWWISTRYNKLKPFLLSLVALPLVLPPTVLGFYLLLLFSPDYGIGQSWESLFGSPLAFSFSGLVIGSVIYSFPFAVQPLYSGFSQFNKDLLIEARLLGLSTVTVWRRIILPAMRPSIFVALGLSFAHTLGEFGVVLMIGGSIEGSTKVVSIVLFEHVESLQYTQAHALSAMLTGFSFVLLLILYSLGRSKRAGWNWI